MARRKYPSDHRPYFRVLESILHDPKLNTGSDDDAEVAWFYMRLLAVLNQRDSQDGRTTLDRRALTHCACRSQLRHAERIASALAVRGLCTLSAVGVQYLISVPKWPEIQGIAPPLRLEEIRLDKKKTKPPPAAAVREQDPLAISFASDFRSALLRVHPGFKPPSESAMERWARAARLLIAERSDLEARALAKWMFDLTQPSEGAAFWRSVVLSVPKFREKFDQLAARKRQEESHGRSHTPGNGPGTSPLAEAARRELRRRQSVQGDAAG